MDLLPHTANHTNSLAEIHTLRPAEGRADRLEGDREKAQRIAADLRTASQGVTLEGISIKDLVEEGRP